MPAVAAGDLSHKVQLQALTVAQDPTTGEMTKTWATIAEPWASMNFQSARDFVAANANQSEVRGFAVIRYRDGVDASMRIVFSGKYYQILGVMPDNESGKEHLTLPFAEGVLLDQ